MAVEQMAGMDGIMAAAYLMLVRRLATDFGLDHQALANDIEQMGATRPDEPVWMDELLTLADGVRSIQVD